MCSHLSSSSRSTGPGQHQQARRDEFLASLFYGGKPATGDDPGALNADVIAALRHLADVIDQWLEFRPFSVSRASPWSSEDRIWSLVDMFQCYRRQAGKSKQLDGHSALSPPSLWRDLGYRHALTAVYPPRLPLVDDTGIFRRRPRHVGTIGGTCPLHSSDIVSRTMRGGDGSMTSSTKPILLVWRSNQPFTGRSRTRMNYS